MTVYALKLRPTADDDLDRVLAAESSAENRPYIMSWTREEHEQAIADPNIGHFVIERVQCASDRATAEFVGYLIMVGLEDLDQGIQLRRIVVTQKGQGIGRWALAQVKAIAFDTHQAHRLWLDVKPFNQRARAFYKSAGFVEEGVLRDCYKTDADHYGSLVIMSMLQPEYAAAGHN